MPSATLCLPCLAVNATAVSDRLLRHSPHVKRVARRLLSSGIHASGPPSCLAVRPELQARCRRRRVGGALRRGRQPRRRGHESTHAMAVQRAARDGAFQGRARTRRPRQDATGRRAYAARHLLPRGTETIDSVRHVHPHRVSDARAGRARLHRQGRRHSRPRPARVVARIALHLDRLDRRVRGDRNRRGDRPGRRLRPGAESARGTGYISRRRGEGAADTTISKELVVLRKSLRLAVRAGLWRGRVDEVIPIAFSRPPPRPATPPRRKAAPAAIPHGVPAQAPMRVAHRKQRRASGRRSYTRRFPAALPRCRLRHIRRLRLQTTFGSVSAALRRRSGDAVRALPRALPEGPAGGDLPHAVGDDREPRADGGARGGRARPRRRGVPVPIEPPRKSAAGSHDGEPAASAAERRACYRTTLTGTLVVVFPAASVATAVRVCVPLDSGFVSSVHAYGVAEAVPNDTPST